MLNPPVQHEYIRKCNLQGFPHVCMPYYPTPSGPQTQTKISKKIPHPYTPLPPNLELHMHAAATHFHAFPYVLPGTFISNRYVNGLIFRTLVCCACVRDVGSSDIKKSITNATSSMHIYMKGLGGNDEFGHIYILFNIKST